ncbi:MAG: PucR family transcriptional regulator ligand-binding domain-containing protein, partial [Tetragenococcus koreensis]|nr:PucR family transcriptional regulator ligand-binding domain-containing protein [Tetragenococcus koreensis]
MKILRLKELMATKLFKECNLLIGNEGLENTISSAMILETLNIENYSSQNQLVMATLYEFQTATKEESKQCFQNMEKQGVSALIIKLNTTIKAIPSYLVEQSTAYHIPLIEAPETVSYEKILLAIYEPTLKKQEHLLRTYYEVRQEFTKVERNLRSFDQIMETFYKLIQLPCSLKIPNLEVDLHYGERFDEYESVQQEFLETTEFT